MAINSKARHDLFQFTPLREGRQHELHNGNADEIFQFTPLREGRRKTHGNDGND